MHGGGIGQRKSYGWRDLALASDSADTARAVNGEPLSKCLSCGVCCYSRLETYVRVTGDDWTRLGGNAGRYAHFIGNRAYMKMRGGHCAALAVQSGSGGEPAYFCTIYENRPQTCRDLERGSPQCEAERELKSERCLISIRRSTAQVLGGR